MQSSETYNAIFRKAVLYAATIHERDPRAVRVDAGIHTPTQGFLTTIETSIVTGINHTEGYRLTTKAASDGLDFPYTYFISPYGEIRVDDRRALRAVALDYDAGESSSPAELALVDEANRIRINEDWRRRDADGDTVLDGEASQELFRSISVVHPASYPDDPSRYLDPQERVVQLRRAIAELRTSTSYESRWEQDGASLSLNTRTDREGVARRITMHKETQNNDSSREIIIWSFASNTQKYIRRVLNGDHRTFGRMSRAEQQKWVDLKQFARSRDFPASDEDTDTGLELLDRNATMALALPTDSDVFDPLSVSHADPNPTTNARPKVVISLQ